MPAGGSCECWGGGRAGSTAALTYPGGGGSLDKGSRGLVADWEHHVHPVLCHLPQGRGWAVVTEGLSRPGGIALLDKHPLLVADSMHHCLETFQSC